ncbi:MAG: hypothetical protein AAGI88_03380 [Pseudomonadota bacterium]
MIARSTGDEEIVNTGLIEGGINGMRVFIAGPRLPDPRGYWPTGAIDLKPTISPCPSRLAAAA